MMKTANRTNFQALNGLMKTTNDTKSPSKLIFVAFFIMKKHKYHIFHGY